MSTPSRFTTFAVAGGTGMLGRAVVRGLLAPAFAKRVVVLSRAADKAAPEGAEIRAVDFGSVEGMTEVLEGIEVVISCLRDNQAGEEPLLAEAAKAAGVQLFVPSDFSFDSADLAPHEPLYFKRTTHDTLDKLGLPKLIVNVGCFPETTFTPGRFGWDFNKGKVEIVGTGEEPYSFTSCPSIGAFLGLLFAQHTPSFLTHLGRIDIEGDHQTLNACLALYQAAHPAAAAKLRVARVPLVESEALMAGLEGFGWFTRWGVNAWSGGRADVTKSGKVGLSNGLVEGWEPEGVEEFMRREEWGESERAWVWCGELA